MERMVRLCTAAGVVALTAFLALGCGGEKFDYTVVPKSYALQDLIPKAVGDSLLNGVARDGRLVGVYQKEAGKPMVPFGWTPDGSTTDLTLPKECKQIDGINEIGQVACSDQSASPIKLYLWQTGVVDTIETPTGATSVAVPSMSFAAGLAATVGGSPGKTNAVQIKPQEKPVAYTTSGDGKFAGVSQNGNLAGTDKVGGKFAGVAVIDSKKVDIGHVQNKDTFATGVNDTGLVVGYTDAAGLKSAFTWRAGKADVLKMPAGATEAVANDVNNGGVVSGKAFVSGAWEACVWFPGKDPVLLKNLATVPAGSTLMEVKVVTPLGIVVATGTKKISGVDKATVFALTPNY